MSPTPSSVTRPPSSPGVPRTRPGVVHLEDCTVCAPRLVIRYPPPFSTWSSANAAGLSGRVYGRVVGCVSRCHPLFIPRPRLEACDCAYVTFVIAFRFSYVASASASPLRTAFFVCHVNAQHVNVERGHGRGETAVAGVILDAMRRRAGRRRGEKGGAGLGECCGEGSELNRVDENESVSARCSADK